MFSKKAAFNIGVDTIIGRETRFVGALNANGTVRIDGYVEGEIISKGDVFVGEDGLVKATIKARNCNIAGEVYGDVDIEHKLELTTTGKIYGNIVAENLLIGEGAVFRGMCEMKRSVSQEEELVLEKTFEVVF